MPGSMVLSCSNTVLLLNCVLNYIERFPPPLIQVYFSGSIVNQNGGLEIKYYCTKLLQAAAVLMHGGEHGKKKKKKLRLVSW